VSTTARAARLLAHCQSTLWLLGGQPGWSPGQSQTYAPDSLHPGAGGEQDPDQVPVAASRTVEQSAELRQVSTKTQVCRSSQRSSRLVLHW
jgi:hypothetical protein